MRTHPTIQLSRSALLATLVACAACTTHNRATLPAPSRPQVVEAASAIQSPVQPWHLGRVTQTTTTTTTAPPVATTAPVVATTTTAVPTPTTAPVVAPVPAGDLYAEWTRVADCEEGGWVGSSGPAYPDSLGINATNWYAYGGGSDVSPAAQIAVAERLITSLGASIPDQAGCAAW